MHYRNTAKLALKRAKQELNSKDDHHLRYAALELRMALESLVYEKATLYKQELSNKKLSTWQPKKLLSLLIEIDPYADRSSSLSFGVEEEYGKPAKTMKPLGTARVLSLKEIKKYYDRLGSYLHTPTSEQVNSGKGASPDKMRTRCNEVCRILEQVLSSPVFNVDMKVTASMDCEECGTKIVRRIPSGTDIVIAECIECSASYELTRISDTQAEWKPIVQDVKCANPSCNRKKQLWKSEVELGTYWICSGCNGKNQISLGLSYIPDPKINKKSKILEKLWLAADKFLRCLRRNGG